MTAEIKMNLEERRKYLLRMRVRYVQAARPERSRLLDEMEAVTELYRKSLLRLMRAAPERKVRQRQRGRSYGAAVDDVIRVVAETLDYICAERLTPALAPTARLLMGHGELEVTEDVLAQLERISVQTVKRIVRRIGQDERRLPRRGPERAQQLLRQVPAERIPWDIAEAGHCEVDLVHHCGPSASGDYLHTLQVTDVATGWSERVAVLGRSGVMMEAGFRRILARLPFALREVHPDNGSEFLNNHLWRFFKEQLQEQLPGLHFSRSRPWQKNDNRFVEQKNQSLVRAYLGFDRLDSLAHVSLVNRLYDQMWLYYNLFQPVLHTVEKTLVTVEGQRPHLKRRYDTAQTPFARACALQAIAAEQRQALEHLQQHTNPRRLRQEIYALLDAIAALPPAHAPVDVREAIASLNQPPPLLSGSYQPALRLAA
jgi:hypothetical protein